jgi:hypothetical protein
LGGGGGIAAVCRGAAACGALHDGEQRARQHGGQRRWRGGQEGRDGRGEAGLQRASLGLDGGFASLIEPCEGACENPLHRCPFPGQKFQAGGDHGREPGARGSLLCRRGGLCRLGKRRQMRLQQFGEQGGFVGVKRPERGRGELHFPGDARKRGLRHAAFGKERERRLPHLGAPFGVAGKSGARPRRGQREGDARFAAEQRFPPGLVFAAGRRRCLCEGI